MSQKTVQITPKSLGAKRKPKKWVREYFSENARQSFRAEGVRYSKEYWDAIEKKLIVSRARKSSARKKKISA